MWKEGNWIVYLNGLVRSCPLTLSYPPHHTATHAFQVLGVHASPLTFVNAIRRLRRRGKVSEFVSVCVARPLAALCPS